MSPWDKLHHQIAFLVESERLKGIVRRVSPIGVPRYENSAEHSWTLALMAVLLCEHSDAQLDLLRVIQMLLIHDLVEIDAGDTFCFDLAGMPRKRSAKSALQIGSLRYCLITSAWNFAGCGKNLRRERRPKRSSPTRSTA